ncbi:hypothetical protein V6N12_046091 [Hibiscus sabdariffa]|uniref:Retroviral polymerase SH3-like domain-containing protein n=1 Tax=Hibiscus sabdariffa TaxID=183260 RepID=A0ABR2G4N7_9ROSI
MANNTISLRSILEKEKLNDMNFLNWYQRLGTNPPRASKDKFEKHMDDMLDVGCLVLATITLELQKQLGMGIFILYAIKPKTLKGSRNSRMKYRINKARVLKTLRSDRVREYLSLDELLKECEIVSQLTPPDMPRWSGVSERRNRTLLDMMSTKLEPKSQKCTFVGYPKETKGYYFYNENKVFVARTGVFLEKEFLTNSGKGRNIELEEVQQQQVIEPEVEGISQAVEENPTDLETQPLRRSTRERHEPERYGFLVTTHGDVILVDQDEPKTYQEAMASPNSEKWLVAMRSEMDSMSENQTMMKLFPL